MNALNSLDDLAGKAGKWLLAAIFLMLPMNTLRPFKEIAVADLLIALFLPIAAFLFLTRYLAKKEFRRFPWWLWAGALLLIVSMALVELLPPHDLQRLVDSFDAYGIEDGSSIVVGLRVIFALIVFPVMIGVVVDRWSTIRLLVSFWIVGVSISCAVAVLDKFLGFDLQTTFAYDPASIQGYLVAFPGEATRMVGLADHPNTLSLTAVMVSPLVMARMKTRLGLYRYGPVLILISLGVLLSGARIGVIGLVLAAGLTLVMDRRFRQALGGLRRRTWVVAATVCVVLGALLFAGAAAPPESEVGGLVPSSLSRLLRPAEATKNVSDRERESRLEDSIGYIKERPVLGYGFQWVESSHNTVLQLILAGGVFGLIGFFLVLLGYLKIGFGLLKRVPEEMKGLTIALTISLLLYLLSGAVINHIFERYLYIPAGLILAIYLMQRSGPEDYPASKEA